MAARAGVAWLKYRFDHVKSVFRSFFVSMRRGSGRTVGLFCVC